MAASKAKNSRKRDPWEQLPDESTKAYAMFCAYLHLGPDRSLVKLEQSYSEKTITVGALTNHCGRHSWVVRANAWDNHLQNVKRRAVETEVQKMAKRHADLAESIIEKIKKKFSQMTDAEVRTMTLDQAARLLEVGVKVERLSRNEPDSIINTKVDAEVGDMTDDELLAEIEQRKKGLTKPNDNSPGTPGQRKTSKTAKGTGPARRTTGTGTGKPKAGTAKAAEAHKANKGAARRRRKVVGSDKHSNSKTT